ncbi:hypothetical protein CJBVI_0037 [Corynebacterium jeikeium]|nr:hypothetical protein CJBVI_0037 [Corynebacterium jeikeium]
MSHMSLMRNLRNVALASGLAASVSVGAAGGAQALTASLDPTAPLATQSSQTLEGAHAHKAVQEEGEPAKDRGAAVPGRPISNPSVGVLSEPNVVNDGGRRNERAQS